MVIINLLLSLSFIFARAENNDENNKVEALKIKPTKIEIKLPEFSEKQLGPFVKIDKFIREEIASHSNAQYFLLNPSGFASQQGTAESFDGTNLVVNSNGFKMTWNVATDTKVISAQTIALLKRANPMPLSTSSVSVGEKVKVHGEWDGSKLVAKRVILIQPKQVTPVRQESVQDLLERIIKMLRERGINIQIPVQPTSTPTTTQ